MTWIVGLAWRVFFIMFINELANLPYILHLAVNKTLKYYTKFSCQIFITTFNSTLQTNNKYTCFVIYLPQKNLGPTHDLLT